MTSPLDQIYQDKGSHWVKPLIIYLGFQALIGFMAVEYAFMRNKRFLESNEKRDKMFPSFRRTDAKYWARWKFYPGAMCFMLTKFLLIILNTILLIVFVRILSCGHDYNKGPMQMGCRKKAIYFFFRFHSTIMLMILGTRTKLRKIEFDYEEYLGADYQRLGSDKRTSTIVSNHVSWMDAVVLVQLLVPAFAPSVEFANAPLIGSLCHSLESIFIPRGGSEESKENAL
jgi:1-acyl-sn-glycerol-3-phosphate acyltransferase